jgi:hypothetical protein
VPANSTPSSTVWAIGTVLIFAPNSVCPAIIAWAGAGPARPTSALHHGRDAGGLVLYRSQARRTRGRRRLARQAPDLGAPRPGMIVLADKGLAGKDIERFAADITV